LSDDSKGRIYYKRYTIRNIYLFDNKLTGVILKKRQCKVNKRRRGKSG